MRMISSFDPSLTASGVFDPQVTNACGRIYLFNESAIGLQLSFQDGSIAGLPPYYFRSYVIRKPGTIAWKQLYNLQSTTTPVSTIFGEAYESAEAASINWTEGPLNRQTNIGNALTVAGGGSTTLTNDGLPLTPSNVFIEATPIGASASTISIATDGTVTIKGDVANVLTTLLQLLPTAGAGASSVLLSDATRRTEVLGTLLVDKASSLDNGTLTTDGAGNINKWAGSMQVSATVPTLSVSSGKTRVQAASGGSVNLQVPAASDVLVVASTGVTVTGSSTLDSGAITTDGSGNITKFAGSMQVDGATPVLSVSGTKTRVQAASGNSINLQVPAATDVLVVTSGAVTASQQLVLASGAGITWKTGDSLSQTRAFTVNYTNATAGQVFSHGMASTPFAILAYNTAGSSATVGVSSITATQFTLIAGTNGNYRCVGFCG